MTARIDWTDEEEIKVVNATKETLLRQGVKLPVADPWIKPSVVLSALRVAQIVLPQERQRPMKSKDSAAKISARMIAVGIITAEANASKAKERELSKDEIRIHQLADERDKALEGQIAAEQERDQLRAKVSSLEVQLARVPQPIDVIKTFCADILADAMSRGKAIVKPGENEEINRLQAEEAERRRVAQEAAAKLAAEAAADRLPKVKIVGLIGQQATEIHAEYKDKLKLRFFQADNATQVRDGVHPGDIVIVWVKFVYHDISNMLNHKGVKQIRVNSMAEMRQALNEIIAKKA